MKIHRVAFLVALLALGATLLPASAVADDASLFASYNSHAEEGQQASAQYRRAVRRAKKSKNGATDAQLQAIIDADRKVNGVAAAVTSEVKGQQPSSTDGTKAKKYAVRGLLLFQKANNLEIASYEQLLAGKERASTATFRKSVQTIRRAARAFIVAEKAFAKAGFKQQ